MQIISKKSFTYLKIVYTIFCAIEYFSEFLGIEPGDCPTDVPVEILTKQGKVFLRFTFESLPINKKKSVFEIADILQNYITYVIFPKLDLPPYCGGTSIYDIVCPIFVDTVIEFENFCWIDILWINNQESFKYMRKKEKERRF